MPPSPLGLAITRCGKSFSHDISGKGVSGCSLMYRRPRRVETRSPATATTRCRIVRQQQGRRRIVCHVYGRGPGRSSKLEVRSRPVGVGGVGGNCAQTRLNIVGLPAQQKDIALKSFGMLIHMQANNIAAGPQISLPVPSFTTCCGAISNFFASISPNSTLPSQPILFCVCTC